MPHGNTVDEAVTSNRGSNIDWHLPTIEELYALTDFSSSLPGVYDSTDISGMIPLLETALFDFEDGDTSDHLIDTQYAYNKYFSSIASDYHLMDNGDDTISDSTLDLTWSHIDSDSASSRKNALAWEEEKNDDDRANKEWILPDTRKLKRILDFSLFPDTTGSAANNAMFNATSLLNTVNQNDYTDSAFKTGRPFINSAYSSSLSVEKTEQEYYWERYFYNDATSYNQLDSAYNVKIFTINTQGNIKGITGKILNLFP